MSKITTDHLGRSAYVYIRQSTLEQVQHNLESQRRQYGLVARARQLGWEQVIVLDDDLGRSGAGTARPGFEKLLAAICQGEVGAVVSIEASRLARNGRDWHTLLEFCGLVGTLIVDEEGIYDPRQPNDRMLLGLKGTFSEMELSMFRQRSVEAKRQKAARGELYSLIPIGYRRTADDRLEMDPDTRIKEAIGLVFRKFREFGSVRQVLLWMRQEGLLFPAVRHNSADRMVTWKTPGYQALLNILSNPIYAGAYVYGRTHGEVRLEGGRKRVVRGQRRSPADWPVLINDHHAGYIDWDEYLRNREIIKENTNMRGQLVCGSVRRGRALLAGLLRCGHCGRRLTVMSSGARPTVRYQCRSKVENPTVPGKGCISFGNLRVDQAVGDEALRVIAPVGLTAALAAIGSGQDRLAEQRRQVELALEQARYEAALARRQYDAVDPDNRLVAGELERRWNERLSAVQRLEQQAAALATDTTEVLSAAEHDRLIELGQDLATAWTHPAASEEIKKRILRAVIREVVVWVEESRLRLAIHWQGGDHTAIEVAKNGNGQHRYRTDADTVTLIGALARLMPDQNIAALLNRAGKRTVKGHTWTESRVGSCRRYHGIRVHREGERAERGEINTGEAAALLGVSKITVIRLIHDKRLPAQQACPGAPFVIRRQDLDLLATRPAGTRAPASSDARQIIMNFQ